MNITNNSHNIFQFNKKIFLKQKLIISLVDKPYVLKLMKNMSSETSPHVYSNLCLLF